MTQQLPLVVIACQVFQDLFRKYLPADLVSQITFLDYGLHNTPKKLTTAVQESLDQLTEPSFVLLGYALCGNGLAGVKSGPHTLLMARADDCIAMLMGSYETYRAEFDANPGTYYLTKGWLESGSDPLREYERLSVKMGPDKAQWVMDMQYQHYKRLMFIAHTEEDLAD